MATTLEFQKRPAIVVAVVVALLVIVFGFGRAATHLLDRAITVPERALPAAAFTAINGKDGTPHGGSLIIGGQEMSNAGIDFVAFPIQFRPDSAGQLQLASGGKIFTLGPIDSTDRDLTGATVYRFKPGAGDEVSFKLERSAVSWPTPLQMNFMTGAQTPTWGRALYYHLRWKKAAGATLEMVWTYDQNYFPADGWRETWTRGGSAGLLRVTIRP